MAPRAAARSAVSSPLGWLRADRSGRSRKRPVEYSILYTATLCLLAFGAVMVYSASSAESLLSSGDASYYLKRYVMFGVVGVVVMHAASRHGLKAIRAMTPWHTPTKSSSWP